MGVDPWSLEEVTMDAGFASVWSFHESIEDLKKKLLCATLELEALRSNAKEEMRKSEESIDQLIQLLRVITHERDVARDQLRRLVNRIANSPNGGGFSPSFPSLQQPESPLTGQARGSCSVTTDSESLSGAPAQHSYGGSPVDSLFDNAGSSEFSSLQMNIQQQGLAMNHHCTPEHDRASAIIDSLAAKKQLPAKGKLLQAVLEAGPTLQTLLLAGPLPQWRNPPPLQPFQVPPVAVKDPNPQLLAQKMTMNPNNLAHASSSPPNVFDHDKPSGATHFFAQQQQQQQQPAAAAALNLPTAAAIKRPMISISPCMMGYDILHVKRQRTQCTGTTY